MKKYNVLFFYLCWCLSECDTNKNTEQTSLFSKFLPLLVFERMRHQQNTEQTSLFSKLLMLLHLNTSNGINDGLVSMIIMRSVLFISASLWSNFCRFIQTNGAINLWINHEKIQRTLFLFHFVRGFWAN